MIAARVGEYPGLRQYFAEREAIRIGTWGVADLYHLPPRWESVPVAKRDKQHEAIVQLQKEGAVLGAVKLEAQCSLPGKNVSVGWEMRNNGSTEKHRWMWRSCPPDGRLKVVMRFTNVARVNEIRVVAGPTQAEPHQRLSDVSVVAETRPHWLYGRELYVYVRRAFCTDGSCDKEALQWSFDP